MIPHRLEKLTTALKEHELDAILVTEPGSRFYLTGWDMFDSQVGEHAFWVLADPEGTTILAGMNDVVEAEAEAPGSTVVGLTRPERRGIARQVARLVEQSGHQRLGYDDVHLPAGSYHQLREALSENVELVPVADLIRTIRAVKEPEELELIREAVRITDEAYEAMIEWLTPGKTEREAAWFLERHMKENGSEGLAFRVILAAGPGGAVPHHSPTDRPIGEGEPCWVDFGAKVGGYCADMTRAFCLGTADDFLQEVYDATIASLDAGIAELKAGSCASRAAEIAYEMIERRGLPCGHALGHGIGLEVHELPSSHPGSQTILEENMVITAEPGIYFPGWGGVRVEDDVLVTAEGPVILNKATRQLVI